MPASVLIVEDEKNTREGLLQALDDTYDVYLAANPDEAFRLMESEEFDVILTDLRMADKSGLSVIDKAVTLPNKPICIMITAYGNVETAVEAMKRGAFDFLTKPVNLEKLEIIIKRALKSRIIEEENVVLHKRLDQKFSFQEIVGHSKPLLQVIDEVKRVAPSKASVLLYGETGTGKELFAQMIHQNSPRARASFTPVHCASLSSNLLESELFGYEKGAFTGAAQRRTGRFEAANGGTLFLDEIGEIDASTQVKLLRFLETRMVERLGGNKPIPVDVRLICATNRNLEEMVKEGTFREDLYYRLNVVNITLPPLRARKADIPILVHHYIDRFSKENYLKPVPISSSALNILTHYYWPGNIRELRNFCENIVVMHQGGELTERDLPPRFLQKEIPTNNKTEKSTQNTHSPHTLSVAENEKDLVKQALIESRGNKTEAAKRLGISRRTLHRKLAQWPELEVNA
ncbi:MAG: transcriptional regulator [Verrucomicrobia bacterium CG_4_10_14_3_um_filter_43_23]|nr:MAG: transcriptional regulator [Verrucomicrobia bacterium CG1_02_43_26]PIP59433.1 MAG: transcriptional regulator [Verrucomicrobia bacterium CG22_combo_CG10-13_8_21_14_all_43_17]PIX57636.1 MAG: transcriptional regulator [Verrucomicrobia bacterium CG_4_10_14_3_um_filter_43_23]PIY61427.1 MAG: transcriptional regulator [Verrucomicrobia bacterium CG_4_10_14_0_8_um_filter_43_34]PJA43785.1 MAG: transcriptional regulator [Verrucomicrobia bacterium CG_4_9_14_3_um_filter_43_20]